MAREERERANCSIGGYRYADGKADHEMMLAGLKEAQCVDSRGGITPDEEGEKDYDGQGTGDGAGFQTDIPHELLENKLKLSLEPGNYGIGHFLLPRGDEEKARAKELIIRELKGLGLEVKAWRETPVNTDILSKTAHDSWSGLEQAVIAPMQGEDLTPDKLEKRLLFANRFIREAAHQENLAIDIHSLSSKSIVYKGLVRASQLGELFPDLVDPNFKTSSFLLHTRFSTSSWPTWGNPQPFLMMMHNGELTDAEVLERDQVARDKEVHDQHTAINPADSDTKIVAKIVADACARGMSLPEALLSIAPPIAEGKGYSEKEQKYLEFLRQQRVPISGPAAIMFNDGKFFGGYRDVGGLRPLTITEYTDQNSRKIIAMGSESRITKDDVKENTEIRRFAIKAGGMFCCELNEDGSIKTVHTEHNVITKMSERWNEKEHWDDRRVVLSNLGSPKMSDTDSMSSFEVIGSDTSDAAEEKPGSLKDYDAFLRFRQTLAFWDTKQAEFVERMAETGKVPVVAMGYDGLPAVLSGRPQRPADFFKQRFLQVTAPARDPREGVKMSVCLGTNPLKDQKAPFIEIPSPILADGDLEKIQAQNKVKTTSLAMHMDNEKGSLGASLAALCKSAENEVRKGSSIVVLSHKGLSEETLPIPDAIAVAAVRNHLEKVGLSMKASIVVESAMASDPHQAAVLLALGASAVSPYMAYEHVKYERIRRRSFAPEKTADELCADVQHGMSYGVELAMSKLCLHDIRQYIGAKGAVMESEGLDLEAKKEAPAGKERVENELQDDFEFSELFSTVPESIGLFDLTMFERMSQEQRQFAKDHTDRESSLPDHSSTAARGFSDEWVKEIRAMQKAHLVNDKIQEMRRKRLYEQVTQNKRALNQAVLERANAVQDQEAKAKSATQYFEESVVAYAEQELAASPVATGRTREEFAFEKYANVLEQSNALGRVTEPERRLLHSMLINGRGAAFARAVFAEQILRELKYEHQQGQDAREHPLVIALLDHPQYKGWLENHLFDQARVGQNPVTAIQDRSSDAWDIFHDYLTTKYQGKLPRVKTGLNGTVKVDGRYSAYDIDHFDLSEANPFRTYNRRVENLERSKPALVHNFLRIVPNPQVQPIDVSEVAPASELLGRFYSGHMSYGSVKWLAHGDKNEAMQAIGAHAGEGEGGQSLHNTDHPLRNGDGKQVASGRFGIGSTTLDASPYELLDGVDEVSLEVDAREDGSFSIKFGQGFKGAGAPGHLPGQKVDPEIAKTRKSMPGVDLVSPYNQHDLYSIEDLKSLIIALRAAGKNVNVKLVSTHDIGQVACGVAKGGAHNINIACTSGGSGAGKHTDQTNAGIYGLFGLIKAHKALVENGLRNNVKLTTSGSFKSVKDFLLHAIWADAFESGTIQLAGVGCVGIDECYKAAVFAEQQVKNGGCTVGVTNTAYNYEGKPEDLERLNLGFVTVLREELAKLGYRNLEEMKKNAPHLLLELPDKILDFIGEERRQKLEKEINEKPTYKGKPHDPDAAPANIAMAELEDRKDLNVKKIIIRAVRDGSQELALDLDISTADVAFGMGFYNRHVAGRSLASMFAKERQPEARWRQKTKQEPQEGQFYTEEDAFKITTRGNAGQRYGFFNSHGIWLNHIGFLHDIVGGSMDGGVLSATPDLSQQENAHNNLIAGHSCLYGARGGKAFFNGCVGDRFAVCNAGASFVVVGDVGENACEYMHGGSGIILGSTGKKLGVNMSGGVLLVRKGQAKLDKDYVNEMVLEESDREAYLEAARAMLEETVERTGSVEAQRVLDNWQQEKHNFIPVISNELMTLPVRCASDNEEIRKAAEQQARDILERYQDDDITPLEEVWLKQNVQSLSLSQTTPFPYSEVSRVVDGQSSISWVAKTSTAAPSGPSCSCGAATCQGTDGCGLGRSTQQGAKKAQKALDELMYRLLYENAVPDEGIWEGTTEAIKERRLTDNEVRLFTEAYHQYAAVSPIMFTKYVCPAPCQSACTKSNDGQPVEIKTYEQILDAFAESYGIWEHYFKAPEQKKDKHIAIVGAGPAGLQAAWRFAREGYQVTVFDKQDGPGGLARYGIPSEKGVDTMAETYADRLKAMGVNFEFGKEATREMLEGFDMTMLAVGKTASPRWLDRAQLVQMVDGKQVPLEETLEELVASDRVSGVTQAMTFLPEFNKEAQRERSGEAGKNPYDFTGQQVMVIGAGDTGNDVLTSLVKLKKRGQLGEVKTIKRDVNVKRPIPGTGFPDLPETADPHRQAALRDLDIQDEEQIRPTKLIFNAKGMLTHVEVQDLSMVEQDRELPKHHRRTRQEPVGAPKRVPVDQLILALGFMGVKKDPLVHEYGLHRDRSGNLAMSGNITRVPGVVVIGDCASWDVNTVVDAQGNANKGVDAALALLEKGATAKMGQEVWKKKRQEVADRQQGLDW